MDNLPGKKYTMCTPKMVSNLQPGSVKVDLEDSMVTWFSYLEVQSAP